MIAGVALIQQLLWVVNAVAGIFLLVWLASRKNHLAFPAFSFYILVNLTLGASVYFIYRRWGFSSVTARRIAWTLVFVVVCARALAVLGLLYSAAAGRHRWELALPSAQRGMELAIAAVIVLLLIFIRYYGVH